jgi:hypothetical protein
MDMLFGIVASILLGEFIFAFLKDLRDTIVAEATEKAEKDRELAWAQVNKIVIFHGTVWTSLSLVLIVSVISLLLGAGRISIFFGILTAYLLLRWALQKT